MLSQLASKQIGINKVVNKIKNNEIPSTPIEKLRFKIGIQKKFSANWKVPTDLLKKTHKKRDNTNVKHEQFKAIDRNKDMAKKTGNKLTQNMTEDGDLVDNMPDASSLLSANLKNEVLEASNISTSSFKADN